LPYLENLSLFFSIDKEKYGGFFSPLILNGDYYRISNSNCMDFGLWSERNIIYMSEIKKYLKIETETHFFPEGNFYILDRDIIQLLFKDKMLYNSLNDIDSFDFSWVKIFAKIDSNSIDEVYTKYIKEKLPPNNLKLMGKSGGIADSMIEHTFERIIFMAIYKLGKVPYIFDSKYLQLDMATKRSVMHNMNQNKQLYYPKKSTICIIACHTGTLFRAKVIINNLKYFKEISDKIVIVNSKEFKGTKYEQIIKDEHPDVDYEYVYNDHNLCYSKWFFYMTSNKFRKIVGLYNNYIVTNDSYLIVKSLKNYADKFNMYDEITAFSSSTFVKKHYTDFLRRYNISGLTKILRYYRANLNFYKKDKQWNLILNIELHPVHLFSTASVHHPDTTETNINFVDKYLEDELANGYEIIKIKKLQRTVYDTSFTPFNINDPDIPDDFNPYFYKFLNPDLQHLDKNQLINHYKQYGSREGRQYLIDNVPYNFVPNNYKYLNDDLKTFDDYKLTEHFLLHGLYEKRRYYCPSHKLPDDFDPEVYRELHSDLKETTMTNDELTRHFIVHGMEEGLVYKKDQIIKLPMYIYKILSMKKFSDIFDDKIFYKHV
jgi:hypothetical protein